MGAPNASVAVVLFSRVLPFVVLRPTGPTYYAIWTILAALFASLGPQPFVKWVHDTSVGLTIGTANYHSGISFLISVFIYGCELAWC